MLTDLKVLNGNMTLKFDKYVNKYSVNIENNVSSLNLTYEVLDGTVRVINNTNLEEGLNYVFIEVTSDESRNIYTLEVYKEKTDIVFNEVVDTKLEVDNITPKETITIISICLILILLSFIIIYRPFKKK